MWFINLLSFFLWYFHFAFGNHLKRHCYCITYVVHKYGINCKSSMEFGKRMEATSMNGQKNEVEWMAWLKLWLMLLVLVFLVITIVIQDKWKRREEWYQQQNDYMKQKNTTATASERRRRRWYHRRHMNAVLVNVMEWNGMTCYCIYGYSVKRSCALQKPTLLRAIHTHTRACPQLYKNSSKRNIPAQIHNTL